MAIFRLTGQTPLDRTARAFRNNPQIQMRLRDSKKSWFDGAKMQDLIATLTRRAFIRIGRFIQVDARRSLVYRSYPSRPGASPHSHTGLLRNLIFFHYDEFSGQLVVGPLQFDAASPPLAMNVTGRGQPTGAGVLEFGGQVEMFDTGKTVTIQARPYMYPSLKRAIAYPKLREAWAEVG